MNDNKNDDNDNNIDTFRGFHGTTQNASQVCKFGTSYFKDCFIYCK